MPSAVRHLVEQDRQQHDEGGAEEAAEDRAEPADDDHEQQLERAVDVEGQRLPGAEVDEGPQRAGDADDERDDREGRSAWRRAAGCRSSRRRCPCRGSPSTARPMWPRTRFLASSANTTTNDEARTGSVSTGVSIGEAEEARAPARVTEPDGV